MPTSPSYLKGPTSDSERLGSKEDQPNFYAHRRYRKWRRDQLIKQRARDEHMIHEYYSAHPEISFTSYNNWLKSLLPLCQYCLKQEVIKPGRVLDHIHPIERGGAKYDEDNLQWLCDSCHDRKRATEDKA